MKSAGYAEAISAARMKVERDEWLDAGNLTAGVEDDLRAALATVVVGQELTVAARRAVAATSGLADEVDGCRRNQPRVRMAREGARSAIDRVEALVRAAATRAT